MNVSREADAAFMAALQNEDPQRYERLIKNIRRDSPNIHLSEEQALTNFMLGLPTGQWRFRVVTGPRDANGDAIQPTPQMQNHELAARKNLRKRIRQAKAMRRLSRTQKRVAGAATI